MEIKRIYIEKLNSKEIDTRFGKKTKLSILSGGNWYSCFLDSWCADWREAQEIEPGVEYVQGKDGRTYANLVDPKKPHKAENRSNNTSSGHGSMSVEAKQYFEKIIESLTRIEKLLDPNM